MFLYGLAEYEKVLRDILVRGDVLEAQTEIEGEHVGVTGVDRSVKAPGASGLQGDRGTLEEVFGGWGLAVDPTRHHVDVQEARVLLTERLRHRSEFTVECLDHFL